MPAFFASCVSRLDQARPAAHRLDGEAAPELELAADLERLPPPGGGEAHAALSHPLRRGQALLHQDLGEVGIAAVLGQPRHVVEELLLGVGAEVGVRDLLGREVRDQRLQVFRPGVDKAEQARGEARVAAGFLLRRSFQNQYSFCSIPRQTALRTARRCRRPPRSRRTSISPILTLAVWITSFQRACSLAMNSAYSCGVEPTASASSALKRSITAALFTAFAASSDRRLMIAGGVFAGAFKPYHWLVSKPAIALLGHRGDVRHRGEALRRADARSRAACRSSRAA